MIIVNWIKYKLGNNSNLLKNFIALFLLQATNFIIPLITFPYLVQVLGLEKFGIISYGLTVLTYLITVVDYGFNLSATRLVSVYRDDKGELSRLFTNVLATKLVLFVLSIIIMGVLCVTAARIQQESIAYMLGMLYVLGNVLMPVWFYQGLEQMKYITYANLIAKVLQLILLFICVKSEQHYIYVLGLYGVANIVSGFYSIWLAVNKYRLKLYLPTLLVIWEQLRNGWYFFSSNLSVSIANSATILILGFFVSNAEIGYYSIAEKVILVAWVILSLFSQAIFPSVCKLAQSPFQIMYVFLKKITLPFIGGVAFGCIIGYIFSDEIVEIIIGHSEVRASHLLRIMVFVPFIVALNIPAYQILLAYDFKQAYSALFNGSAVLNVILCTALVYVWGVIGAAVSMVIVQTIITLSLYLLLAIKLKTILGLPNFKIG